MTNAQPPEPAILEFEFIAQECSDGIDNDGDRRVDFPEDPDCVDPEDEAERRPTLAHPTRARLHVLRHPRGVDRVAVFDVSNHGKTIVGSLVMPNPWDQRPSSVGSIVWRGGNPRVIHDLRPLHAQKLFVTSGAAGVSDDGRIVTGTTQRQDDPPQARAYRWTRRVFTQLGPQNLLFGDLALARAVSNTGVVVGLVSLRPARWDDDEPTFLDPEPSSRYISGFGIAHAVTPDASIIVGSSPYESPDGPGYAARVATIWTIGDLQEVLIPPLHEPRFLSGESEALDVSDSGDTVVGTMRLERSISPDRRTFAFRHREGRTRFFGRDIPDVDRRPFITLTSIAGDGSLAVGWAEGVGPIVLDGSRLRSLTDLLENEYEVELGGWDLAEGVYDDASVSPDGRIIVGNGTSPEGKHAAWWVRLPPACSDGLDNDGDGDVDFRGDESCRSRAGRTEADVERGTSAQRRRLSTPMP